MTGWNNDEKTLNFVKEMKSLVDKNSDLMPDAWYHLALTVESESIFREMAWPTDINKEHLYWLKKDPDLLRNRIASNIRLRKAYVDGIIHLDSELDILNDKVE